ncbi:phosphopantetheine-binding protein [Amycolatopsis sp. NBC_00345]|uniref:phosphopantetheine-binding protein n=1 Tax=Amycolatopsis sp. NBC_00345 TaxID=2975955 RepID=UPI002E25CCCE
MHTTSDIDTDIATLIAGAIGDVLICEPPELDRDFFLHGGDSVRAVELVTKLTELFGARTGDQESLSSALLLAVFDDASPNALAIVTRKHLQPA